MIENLTNTARLYAQARAEARAKRNAGDAAACNDEHDRAHVLAIEADYASAVQITAIARVFAKNRKLSCPLTAVLDAELLPVDAAP